MPKTLNQDQLKAYREEAGQLRNEFQTILDLGESDNRQLTDEETARLEAIENRVAEIKTTLANSARLEAISGGLDHGTPQNIGRDGDLITSGGDEVPRDLHRTGPLRAFTGEGAEQNAYRAGMFLLAVLSGSDTARTYCADRGISLRNQAGGTNSLGGVLVPTELATAIIDLREAYGIFRQEARIWPMASDMTILPRRTGGVTAYFVGENTAATASDKTWDGVELTARKLQALVKYPSELAEDAVIALAEDLANEIAYAMALKEDQCGFVGDGTSTYGGIVGVVNAVEAGSIKGAATGNDSFETLDLADFEGAVGKLPEYAEGNAKWYISKAGYWASMARLMNAAGGNTTETLADGTRQKMFLGYPVITSQVMNSTLGTDASAPKAIIGDLRQGATVGDRRGFTLATSEHNDFESDQIAIRGNQRFDINVHERGTGTAAGALVLVKSAA